MARKKEVARIPTTNIRREQIFDKCKGICCHCGTSLVLGDNFSIEHVIPLNKGGTNEMKNIVALCKDCNFDKGDDVVDASYYEYAPKLVQEEIVEILEKYYEEKDWLTEVNPFKHDRFTVPIERTLMLKNGKIYAKKDTCEVKKMLEEDFDAFIETRERTKSEYQLLKDLQLDDDEEREMLSPTGKGATYQIVFKGKTVAAFLCSVVPGTGKGTGLNGRGMFRTVVIISPDIKWGPSSRIIISDCISEVISQFVKSMNEKKTKALLLCCVDVFADDKRGIELIETFSKFCGGLPLICLYDAETDEPTFIRGISVLGFGVEVDTVDGRIDMDEFLKKEKLYSGKLRRRLSANG